METTSEEKLTIAVPVERVIDAAVEKIVAGEYDEEEGYYGGPGVRFRERIEKKIEARIDALLDEALRGFLVENIRARVEPMIDEAVASGFPRFDEYGTPRGTTTWQATIREAIDGLFKGQGYGSRSWASDVAKKAFEEHAAKAFKAEAEAIRAKVREYVDEQLAGTVVKALREAVGLR